VFNARTFAVHSLIAIGVLGLSAPTTRAATPTDEQKRVVTVLEQAVKTDGGNSELWVHLGFAYRKSGQMDLSQAAFEKAAQLNPKGTDAFYMLGLIYENKHDNTAAEKAWTSYMANESDASKRRVAEKHIHQINQ